MSIALVFAMKLREKNIYLNNDLEEFIKKYSTSNNRR